VGLEALNPANEGDVEVVARLHSTLLADSPVVKMGARFLRRFYYRTLVAEALISCTVFRAEGRIVGFISYTSLPFAFMSTAVKRHFFRLSWIMLVSIVHSPKMIRELIEVVRLLAVRGSDIRIERVGTGEALSLAVLPEFRRTMPPGSTKRVALSLFECAAEALRKQGAERILVMVQPSNRAANIFFSMLGCQMEKITWAGQPVHRYIYSLKPQAAEAVKEARI